MLTFSLTRTFCPSALRNPGESDLAIWHVELAPGAACTLPAAAGGTSTNRAAYFVEGAELRVAGIPVKQVKLFD